MLRLKGQVAGIGVAGKMGSGIAGCRGCGLQGCGSLSAYHFMRSLRITQYWAPNCKLQQSCTAPRCGLPRSEATQKPGLSWLPPDI